MMPDDRTRALLARGRRVAGPAANAEIARERTRKELAHGRALAYEVVLGPSHGFAHLVNVVAPRLASYLAQKKWSASRCGGVFVALWTGDEVHLIDAPVFFEAVRQAEGLDDAAWRARVHGWEAA
jgi:hypothetical protein